VVENIGGEKKDGGEVRGMLMLVVFVDEKCVLAWKEKET
jgi:hypothetical protein